MAIEKRPLDALGNTDLRKMKSLILGPPFELAPANMEKRQYDMEYI